MLLLIILPSPFDTKEIVAHHLYKDDKVVREVSADEKFTGFSI